MKKTKKIAALAVFGIATFAMIFAGCKNDEDDTPANNPSESTNEVSEAELLENMAFTVLRSLTDMTKYDENAVTEEDGTVSGIETLPDDWKTATFECDEGFVLNTATPTVRSIPVNGFDDALEFFSGIIGESLSEESLSGGTYDWSYPGLGSLTFKKGAGDEFATVDVNLPIISNLTQLRFISTEDQSLTSANSYEGKTYYHAGDVIMRNKDKTYWICVRPAAGPYKKDKSYWISLDAFNNAASGKNAGKTTIKSKEKKVEVYYNKSKLDYDYAPFKQTWTYATNLMSLKTAKAANHTFSSLVMKDAWNLTGYWNAQKVYEALKDKGIDLMALHRNAFSTDGLDSRDSSSPAASFAFAYGSPKDDSKRGSKLNGNDEDEESYYNQDIFKTVGQVKYVQPFLYGETSKDADGLLENICTIRHVNRVQYSTYKNVDFLLSLTDSFDMVFTYLVTEYYGDSFCDTTGVDDAERASKYRYDFRNYLHALEHYDNPNSPGALGYVNYDSNYAQYMKIALLAWHVIISPELTIPDNKGPKDGSTAVRPVKDTEYMDIYVQGSTAGEYFDYWTTLNRCTRKIDGKTVSWDKENK